MYFESILSTLLAAFRKHYGCNHVLVNLLEQCKHALDKKENIGMIFLDLSKAFDCLPHNLLLCKLKTYGLSEDACLLIKSYLNNRLQRVKICSQKSNWALLKTGVPQGSVLGPLLFNIFINDLFYQLKDHCSLHNYADDNTLFYSNHNVDILKSELAHCTDIALKWFDSNCMKANPDKFKCMFIGKNCNIENTVLNIDGNDISSERYVKLLGIHLDTDLNFEKHVSLLCRRAAYQVRALGRISKYIDLRGRTDIYNAFIASNFRYCDIIWHFCSHKSTYAIEKLNKRALRVILNDFTSSYSVLLEKMESATLFTQRIKSIACEVYKSLNKLNPKFMHDIFTPNEHGYYTRDRNKCVIPIVSTHTSGINSFSFQGAKIWNDIP